MSRQNERDFFDELLPGEQEIILKKRQAMKKLLEEPAPSLSGLSTAADYLNARFERDKKIFKFGENVYGELLKLSQEAERHRIDYNQRSIDTEQPHYWRGRRDEAGHFRDRILALLESV